MKKIKEGIYKTNRKKISFLDKNFISILQKDASSLSSLRSRILYHSSTESSPQQMFICFDRDSTVPVSMHTFSESFLIINGVAHYRFYKKTGEVFHDIRLSPAHLNGTFYVFIKKEIPHRFFSLSKYTLANEVGHSYFSPKFTKYGSSSAYKKANRINLSDLNKEFIYRNSKTIFKKFSNNYYKMNSHTGIIELSYKDILLLINNNKNPFFLFPDVGAKLKKKQINNLLEKIYVMQPKKTSKLVLKNSYLSIIKGAAEIKFGNKKIVLDENKKFVLGPIINDSIIIKNFLKNSIFHISNEK